MELKMQQQSLGGRADKDTLGVEAVGDK